MSKQSDASKFFNSLPMEQRVALIPLLNEIRVRGQQDVKMKLRAVIDSIDKDSRGILELRPDGADQTNDALKSGKEGI